MAILYYFSHLFTKMYADKIFIFFLRGQVNASLFVCEVVRDRMAGGGLEAKIESFIARMTSCRVEVKEDVLRKAADGFEF